MKPLVFLILALAAVNAFEFRTLQTRNVEMPVLDEPTGRITNGEKATVGQFPYQVGLSLKLNLYSSSWCGGSLIGNSWVLTAAHCTDGVQSVTVYLGATERTSAEATYTVSSNNIIIHENWDPTILQNDISLIRIPSVAYSNRIQAVKLPNIADSYHLYTGDVVVASGWGRISDSINSVTEDLQWAVLEVISNTKCAMTYGSKVILPTNICVDTSDGVSTCQGDSGGPLVLVSSGVQVGLTSFGAADGCEKGYPVAFTRLTSYLDWIKSHTGVVYY
ncbi:collagenase-like [Teleopsis dalmanni]|uniref:collagenase-like n=1 Tax=Teleopsis dalmanni TaxID=139649 RepID=UPI0018CDDD99|nr:collagenase-like [Teleopsis dalmanni]